MVENHLDGVQQPWDFLYFVYYDGFALSVLHKTVCIVRRRPADVVIVKRPPSRIRQSQHLGQSRFADLSGAGQIDASSARKQMLYFFCLPTIEHTVVSIEMFQRIV